MITLGWTGVIIFQEWVRPYIVMCLILLTYTVIKVIQGNKLYYKIFDFRDLLLILFIGYAILLSYFLPNEKSFNYILAYTFVFIISYSITKYFFFINPNFQSIQKYNYVGVLILLIYGIFEIINNNFLTNDLISTLWQNRTNGAIANIGPHSFIRSYGMMPEPSIFGLYLNSLGVLSIYYVRKNHNPMKSVIFYLLFAINYYFISSAASLFSIVASIILIQFLFSRRNKNFVKSILYLIIVSIVVSFLVSNFNPTIIGKIINPDIYSVDRYQKWLLAVELISNMTGFGKGLGYVSLTYGSSLNNWYLMLLFESGIIGLVIVLLFLIISINKGFSNQNFKPYLIGIISNIIHFGAISTFFNPFLFITIALMDISLIEKSVKKVRT